MVFRRNHPRGEIGYGKTQESDEGPPGGEEKAGDQEEGRSEKSQSQAREKGRAAQSRRAQTGARRSRAQATQSANAQADCCPAEGRAKRSQGESQSGVEGR